jgi:hypothetical protein
MTTSPSHRAPGREIKQRRRAAATSLLIALALNLGALGAVGAVVAQWRIGGSAPNHAGAVITMFVVPRALPDAAPESTLRSAPVQREPIKVQPEPQRQTPATATQALAPTIVAPSDATNAIRYYSIAEVDRPAIPDSDWNLDTAAFDAAGLSRMVFEVLVGAAGEVAGCAILEPETLDDTSRARLEERLRQTVLQPALRDGVAVPSVRRIEISVVSATE